ncbi:efflux transporter, RND family, MFP subunit [Fibrisoma limi BUZ 3]|uniref:Efflux transporter, RND family, MFP subunit n=1 Tax=Fibrisoma limi BUZ 3 TaxID=1185876 RepID=I2GNK9_9BACT|nr:efflux RND transporter periplasmic adaptor subunit [Fibrisoma limi]CCH55487.1 efflux transporter, RND family, MFP subunit [Fibrisoma limi BUZ 3]
MKKRTIIPPCSRPLRLRNYFGNDLAMPSGVSFGIIVRKNQKPGYRQIMAAVATLLLAGSLTSCHSSAESENATTKQAHQDVNLLSTARFDTARLNTVTNELDLTGKITFNQDKVVKVFPLVGGHIEQVKIELGDYVHKGQVLAVLRSGDLADLEQQAITARSQLAVAQKNVQVTEDMAKSGFSAQRDLLVAREQLEAARGEVNRVNERRRILGGNGSEYVVKAPVSGFVVEKTASPGMELRSDDPENLFTISNLDQVWVLANVYESDLANIHAGDSATITTLSYPDRVFHGRIDKIFNVLDPESKTMKVRVTLNNADFQLKPEMFANVRVAYAGHDKRVAIPTNAVVFDKSRNFVVSVTKENQPVVREVDIYKTTSDKSYINSGLSDGERIITKNQLLIYNALAN